LKSICLSSWYRYIILLWQKIQFCNAELNKDFVSVEQNQRNEYSGIPFIKSSSQVKAVREYVPYGTSEIFIGTGKTAYCFSSLLSLLGQK
jgi:hypothetical protein